MDAEPTATVTPRVRPSASPESSSAPAVPPSTVPEAGATDPKGAPPIDGLTGYQWPLPNARLTLPFGPTPWGGRVVDGEKFHDGIDLATFCGDKVVAAHDGVVLAAGRRYDDQMGWLGDLSKYKARLDAKKLWITLPIVVVIDDGNGYRSIYAHFGKIVVKKGQAVTAGSLLGYEGRTGRASGCHLHYGLFSPDETAEFGMDPVAGKRMKLPSAVIARVDPQLVLPERPKPGSKPKPTPKVSPAP
jgi:murein DD-endopeptidase MepM/ murein hydrolase activator NlpD